MNMYHVTCDKNKKILKANVENISQKIEAAFNISMEDKFLQYFYQDFEDWVDLDSDIPEKAKLRVVFTATGKNNLQNIFWLMKICSYQSHMLPLFNFTNFNYCFQYGLIVVRLNTFAVSLDYCFDKII